MNTAWHQRETTIIKGNDNRKRRRTIVSMHYQIHICLRFLRDRNHSSNYLWETLVFSSKPTFAKRNIAREIYFSIPTHCSVRWNGRTFLILPKKCTYQSHGRVKVLIDRKVTLKSKGGLWFRDILHCKKKNWLRLQQSVYSFFADTLSEFSDRMLSEFSYTLKFSDILFWSFRKMTLMIKTLSKISFRHPDLKIQTKKCLNF